MTKELYINNNLIDLGDANPTLTKQANDIAKPSTLQSDYTNQFKVPRNAHNELAFEFSSNINSNTALPYKKLPARYIVNGYEIVNSGFAIIEEHDSKTFNIRIYSGTKSFFADIEGKKLKELVLDDCNSVWLASAVVSSPNPNVVYPLLQNFDSALPFTGPDVTFNYIFPAVFGKRILEEIGLQNGWTISVPTYLPFKSIYEKLILPFVNETPVYSDKYYKGFAWKAVKTSDQATSGISTVVTFQDDSVLGYDPANHFDPLTNEAYYTPSQKIKVRVNIKLDLQITTGTCIILIQIGGQTVYTISETVTQVKTFTVEGFLVSTASGTGDMVLLVHTSPTFESSFTILALSDIEVINSPITYGNPWEASPNLPDITQKDFFKSICYLFGLIPDTNPGNKTVNLRLFREIYDNIPYARDWSKKLIDSDKALNKYRVDGYAQKNYYKWKKGADFENITDKYGDGEFLVSDENLDVTKDIFTHPFAATQNTTKGLKIPYIPIIGADGNAQTCSPRLLVLNTYVAELNLTAVSDFVITPVPVSSMPSGDFEPIKYENQYAEFYSHLFGQMLDKTKAPALYFKLDEADVFEFDHFIPVYLNTRYYTGYFYVNKITNFIAGKETLVELIRL